MTKAQTSTPTGGGAQPAKLGRPRASAITSQDDPREEILRVSAQLFTSSGYRQTSTLQIANAVGLRQASLFYYFPRKEDILTELLDRMVRTQLSFADGLSTLQEGPDVQLYLLIYSDVRTLSSPPGNLGWLMYQPEARTPRFANFQKKYARLRGIYESLISAGAEQGLFTVVNVELTARIVCGLVDGVATWYDAPLRKSSREELWVAVTDHAMRGILTRPARLAKIRATAEAIRARLDPT